MSTTTITLAVCAAIIVLAALGTAWLKRAGDASWRRHQKPSAWAALFPRVIVDSAVPRGLVIALTGAGAAALRATAQMDAAAAAFRAFTGLTADDIDRLEDRIDRAAAALNLELLPWQRDVLRAHLSSNGQRVAWHHRSRRGGWTTVQRVADLLHDVEPPRVPDPVIREAAAAARREARSHLDAQLADMADSIGAGDWWRQDLAHRAARAQLRSELAALAYWGPTARDPWCPSMKGMSIQ